MQDFKDLRGFLSNSTRRKDKFLHEFLLNNFIWTIFFKHSYIKSHARQESLTNHYPSHLETLVILFVIQN